MEKKENPGGQAGTQENASAFFTRLYCTTGGRRAQDWICDFLSEGRENALSAKELSQILHVQKRTISRAIERARRSGVPILASVDRFEPGYYLPESESEIQEYLKMLRHRLREIHTTESALATAATTWFSEGGDGA